MGKVLFADDSAVARAATSERLSRHGVELTAVASHAEASDVDGRELAAALLDLELGDGLGTDVAARLRASAPELPIAFLTSASATEEVARARAFGPVFSKLDGLDEAVGWVLAVLAS